MKKIVVIEVDYSEIEALAQEHYGAKDYSFPATQECGNDSSHRFNIDGKIDKFDKDDAVKIRQGKIPNYHNRSLLNCLCADGHIEAGTYIVKVSW